MEPHGHNRLCFPDATFYDDGMVWNRLLLCLAGVILALGAGACGDEDAPRILSVSFPPDTSDPLGPFWVEAVVDDDRGVHDVVLLVATDVDTPYTRLQMDEKGEGHWEVSFGELAPDTTLYLIVEAIDAGGNRAQYPDPAMQQETGCVVAGELCWHRFQVLAP